MKKFLVVALAFVSSLAVYAGGNPEHVAFPIAYKADFIAYDTRNRVNGKQVAVMYANKVALDSASSGKLAAGSKIIMEVYKPKKDEDGKPVIGANGVFEKAKLAAVAVMEKREAWDAGFAAKDRAGDWGFAIYNPDGTPKENNLECATCHTPMPDNDFMFSYSSLVNFSR